MRRHLGVAVFILCLSSILPRISWSGEAAVQGILHPLCGSCEKISVKVLDALGTRQGLNCELLGNYYTALCDADTGGDDVLADSLCTAGGYFAQRACLNQYGGSPEKLIRDAKKASKLICEEVKLCK